MPPTISFPRTGAEALARELLDVREAYRRDGFVFLPGRSIAGWLSALGADTSGLDAWSGQSATYATDPDRGVVYRVAGEADTDVCHDPALRALLAIHHFVTGAGAFGVTAGPVHPAGMPVGKDSGHVMVTLLAASNLTAASALTLVHDRAAAPGIAAEAVADAVTVGQARHRHRLDTLLADGSRVRLSRTPAVAADGSVPMTLDLLTVCGGDRGVVTPMPGHRTSPLLAEPQPGTIDVADFLKLDIRVGRVVTAEPLPKARIPAYAMTIDFGELGRRATSARLTDRYEAGDLPGKDVLAVVNLPDRRVAGIDSQVLVLGLTDDNRADVVLAVPDMDVPLGRRLS